MRLPVTIEMNEELDGTGRASFTLPAGTLTPAQIASLSGIEVPAPFSADERAQVSSQPDGSLSVEVPRAQLEAFRQAAVSLALQTGEGAIVVSFRAASLRADLRQIEVGRAQQQLERDLAALGQEKTRLALATEEQALPPEATRALDGARLHATAAEEAVEARAASLRKELEFAPRAQLIMIAGWNDSPAITEAGRRLLAANNDELFAQRTIDQLDAKLAVMTSPELEAQRQGYAVTRDEMDERAKNAAADLRAELRTAELRTLAHVEQVLHPERGHQQSLAMLVGQRDWQRGLVDAAEHELAREGLRRAGELAAAKGRVVELEKQVAAARARLAATRRGTFIVEL